MKTDLSNLLASLGAKGHKKSYEEGRDLLGKVCKLIADKYDLSILCCATRDDVNTHQTFVNGPRNHIAMFVHSVLVDKSHGISSAIDDKHWRQILGKRFSPMQKSFYVIIGMGVWAFISSVLPMIVRMFLVQMRGF